MDGSEEIERFLSALWDALADEWWVTHHPIVLPDLRESVNAALNAASLRLTANENPDKT